MTSNELELINLIRNNADPSYALTVAVSVILDFLKQSESISVQAAVDLQERA